MVVGGGFGWINAWIFGLYLIVAGLCLYFMVADMCLCFVLQHLRKFPLISLKVLQNKSSIKAPLYKSSF